jgi:hypothetical protein
MIASVFVITCSWVYLTETDIAAPTFAHWTTTISYFTINNPVSTSTAATNNTYAASTASTTAAMAAAASATISAAV